MCGRFTLWLQLTDLIKSFPDFIFPDFMQPRFNIAPTQPVAVVPNNTYNTVEYFRWGLVPFWAKDVSIGSRMINARAETLGEKPSFRAAYKRRRCLILADGFYEWQKIPGQKQKVPTYITMKNKEPFAFAGLWESWRPDDTPVLSTTIITTEPNELIASIHSRMPVILPRESWDAWLDPTERLPRELQHLLVPYEADAMQAVTVSSLVNKPTHDSPACIEPAQQLSF